MSYPHRVGATHARVSRPRSRKFVYRDQAAAKSRRRPCPRPPSRRPTPSAIRSPCSRPVSCAAWTASRRTAFDRAAGRTRTAGNLRRSGSSEEPQKEKTQRRAHVARDHSTRPGRPTTPTVEPAVRPTMGYAAGGSVRRRLELVHRSVNPLETRVAAARELKQSRARGRGRVESCASSCFR